MSFAEEQIREWRIATVSTRHQLAEARDVTEEDINRQLVAEGLIRVPPATTPTAPEFKRIDVDGKPMSEMIIEERR